MVLFGGPAMIIMQCYPILKNKLEHLKFPEVRGPVNNKYATAFYTMLWLKFIVKLSTSITFVYNLYLIFV